MNRSLGWIGVGVMLAGLALVASPVALYGRELLDPEQIAGFLIAPVGLFVVMLAAAAVDPRRTTITGTFGNPDELPPAAASTRAPVRARLRNPNEAVHCRHCRSVVTADLSRCPRCARARDCRSCGRPLGQVLDRPTCPTCARAEAFCNCAVLARAPTPRSRGRGRDVAG
jgi:hypothetical protein